VTKDPIIVEFFKKSQVTVSTVILLFVVPSHRFDSFTFQKSGGLNCKQFVMEVPIEDMYVDFADSVELPEL
jgi:hypothetical protein